MKIFIENYNCKYTNNVELDREKINFIKDFTKSLIKNLGNYGVASVVSNNIIAKYEKDNINNYKILQEINSKDYDLVISIEFPNDSNSKGCYAIANDKESKLIADYILTSLEKFFENKGCFKSDNDILLNNYNSKIIKLSPFSLNNPIDLYNARLYGFDKITNNIAKYIANIL